MFLSRCFALLYVLTLSSDPVLLNTFILAYEGKEKFKYEGHVLAISFFFSKCLKSMAQR